MLVVSGPSGVGKTSVVEGLAATAPFHFSVSATTRPLRPGEVDGVDYHFIDPSEFQRMIDAGLLLEWAEYGGHRYGTPRRPVEEHLERGEDVLLDIENQGAEQIRRSYPEAVLVFLAPPSWDELERRLRSRGDTSDDEIRERLGVARSQLEAATEVYDHIVVNDDLVAVIAEVASILLEPDRSVADPVTPYSRQETAPHDDD